MQRITIDPITRLEGHGKIEIFLNGKGDVSNSYFQIPELRGFERFCVGRPVEEMPLLTNRICGVCPEAHHMAAAKAADMVYHVDPPPHRQTAARAALQRLLLHRSHHALLRAGRPRFRHGPRRAGGRAEHPGRDPQGRAGDRRQGHPGPQERPPHRRDDRRPQGASRHVDSRRHDERASPKNSAEEIEQIGRVGRRVRPVQPEVVQRHRAGQYTTWT